MASRKKAGESTFMKNGVLVRICSVCHRELPLNSESFHKGAKNGSSLGTSFRYTCKECIAHPWVRPRGNPDFKECSDCHETFPRTSEYFHSDRSHWSGLNTICKGCVRIRGKKRYNEVKNSPGYKEHSYKKNREWLIDNEDHAREWRATYYKNKYNEDIEYRIMSILRQRVRSALKGTAKDESTINLLGCDISFFKAHIESLFTEGMSWDNHGRGSDKWHLDHICPCASFDLTCIDDQKKCFHYTNIQPLWESENLKKFSSYNGIIYRNGSITERQALNI